MSLETSQKLLKITGIIAIIFGVFGILSGVLAIFGGRIIGSVLTLLGSIGESFSTVASAVVSTIVSVIIFLAANTVKNSGSI